MDAEDPHMSSQWLESLRAEPSEQFVQQVMRKVRLYEKRENSWNHGWWRWMWPGMSIASISLLLALAYVEKHSLPLGTDLVLMAGQETNDDELFASAATYDPIVDLMGTPL